MKSKLFLSLSLLTAIGSISAKSVSPFLPTLSINSLGKEVWFLGSKVLTPKEAFQFLAPDQKKEIRKSAWREYHWCKKLDASSAKTPATPVATVSTQQILDATSNIQEREFYTMDEKKLHDSVDAVKPLLLEGSSVDQMIRSQAMDEAKFVNTVAPKSVIPYGAAREEAKSDSYYDILKAAYAAGVVSVGSALSGYANPEETSTQDRSDLGAVVKQENNPLSDNSLINANAPQAPSWFDSAKTFSSNHQLSVGTGAVVATAGLCYLAYVKRAAISAKAKKAGSSVVNLFKRK